MPRRKRRHPPSPPPPAAFPAAWDALYPTLDLHGETAEGARRRAEGWLRARQEEGKRTVRVITGRGRHSPGPAVLRGEIEDLLTMLRGSVVAAFALEPGGGAFRIELRRAAPGKAGAARTARPPSSATALRDLDPELRQRAEEALVELGITPTPELLRAQVRRIRDEESA